jgi:serine/threonine protein kinase
MTGQTIKEYTLEKEIGKGGMATVYLAMDKKFQTKVAVKVLNKEFIHNENIRHRFLAEARNMYRMSHPNVIKVTDLIDDGDLVAFVMEYVEGQTLKDYLENKSRLSDQDIKRLFTQMLAAVGYVHEQGMVHRDIKPSNFMINKKGDIRLLDFGIAKNTDITSAEYTMTGTTQNMGTPIYMSPEQIKSSKDVQAPSDIYSMGVVLWQMVTGKKPYELQTSSTFDIQVKIVNEPLSSTGTVWDAIIKKATQKEISNRYPDIRSFQQAVSVLDDQSDKTQILQTLEDRTVIEKVNSLSQIAQQKKRGYELVNHHNVSRKKIGRLILTAIAALGIGTAVFIFIRNSGSGTVKYPNTKVNSELKDKMIALINKWNNSLNTKDLISLSSLYADKLIYYRVPKSRDECIKISDEFNKEHPSCYQQIIGEINIENTGKDSVKCNFVKKETRDGKTTDYPSYLHFTRENGEWKIIEEGDLMTDINVGKGKAKQKQELNVGNYYQGGIIFYIDNTGSHGLIAAEKDLDGKYTWDQAMQNCAGLNLHEYQDWRLPTKEELAFLRTNKEIVGGFENHGYWSSTEYDNGTAWFQGFKYGVQDTSFKASPTCVRAVRAF